MRAGREIADVVIFRVSVAVRRVQRRVRVPRVLQCPVNIQLRVESRCGGSRPIVDHRPVHVQRVRCVQRTAVRVRSRRFRNNNLIRPARWLMRL